LASFAIIAATCTETVATHLVTPTAIDAPKVGMASASAISIVEMMSPRIVVMMSRSSERTAPIRAPVVSTM